MAALNIGTVLRERYEIASLFGSSEGTAAYLADDRVSRERLLIWESAERFTLRQRPPGAREYFEAGGHHYLVLRLEGQNLALMRAACGRVDETPAGLWLLQVCRALGYWHNRAEGPLVCLRQGPLSLSLFSLMSHDLLMIPSYGDFGRAAGSDLPVEDACFTAPEQGDALSPRSDVYALGAMLYCLLTGQVPPEAAAGTKSRLAGVRRLNPGVSAAMEKIVSKALHLDPGRRYPTGAEMAADLEQLLIPQLLDKKQEKKKPSLLMRAVPFMVTLAILCCLAGLVQALTSREWRIKLPNLPSWPTPTFTPLTPATPGPTATWTPTPTPAPTVTSIPARETILNQIRLDQYPWIIVYTSVLDVDREPVRDLTKEQFWVRQDDVDVTDFEVANVDAAQDPLTLVVAVDVSGSMKGEPIAKAREAAANFVSRFDVGDRVALLKFNHQIGLVHDFTTDKAAVVQAIDTLQVGGDTALYDVIAQAVERLAAVEGRRAVIVLSDGRDTASMQHKLDSAIRAATAAGIPVYVVGLDSPQFTPDILNNIADDTGGDYLYAPAPDALDALYQTIRGQLQNQYRLEFQSLHDPDGQEHTVSVGVKVSPDEEISAEKKYRAP